LFWPDKHAREREQQLERKSIICSMSEDKRSRSPSMGVAAAALSRSPDRRDTLGILRVDTKPRRSSGTSVEFRDLQVGAL